MPKKTKKAEHTGKPIELILSVRFEGESKFVSQSPYLITGMYLAFPKGEEGHMVIRGRSKKSTGLRLLELSLEG